MSESVLILGSGSREHALAWKLSQSTRVGKVIVSPGNGGTERVGGKISNLALNIKDNDQVVQWCVVNKPSLVVVGPEDPLNNGIADALAAKGIPCFGPSQAASQIECDKNYAKDFMTRHDIPTAKYKSFTDADAAKQFIREADFNALVVKANGLAGGKGVVVAKDAEEACRQVDLVLTEKVFGKAGESVIVEELLIGQEVSVLAFIDGSSIQAMPPAQDHKRAYDGDEGPNTGGMGAYCPCPFVNEALIEEIEETVLQRAVDGLRKEGRPFLGVLFAGIILTKEGPKVLEYNCRFGDPETQSILPLLESDLYEIFVACVKGTLSKTNIQWNVKDSVCGVVMASGGYPASATKGVPIYRMADAEASGLLLFHGGTEYKAPNLVTSGGRVLSIVATASSLEEAAKKALNGAKTVKIQGSFYRKDIGAKAFQRQSLSYKASGVDIEAGEDLVEHIKGFAKNTVRRGVMESIGGFGALFDLKASGYDDPILVSGTDGVGTKLRVALETKKFDTVGIDLVAMCVNDILVQGAEPLFFLDYFACSKLDVEMAAQVIKGIARGCQESNCALVGGETAEMPGMYSHDDFDLAGFAVGAVKRHCLLPRKQDIQEGDVIIGLPSSGVHSNGFSLVRKIMSVVGKDFNDRTPFARNKTFGEVLLSPTKIYVKSLLPVLKMGIIKGLAHITGGGLTDNIPRILRKELAVDIDAKAWTIPPIFQWLQSAGNLHESEMLRTFNCGIGMTVIVSPENAELTLRTLKLNGESEASIIGKVTTRTSEANKVVVRNFNTQLNQSVKEVEAKRVAVLISGGGTNLQALLDHTQDGRGQSAARIVLVISNIAEVQGLKRAQQAGVATKVISHKGFKSRLEFDMAVHEALVQERIELVCLAGFMRIVTKEFVKLWEGKLINIHPSLLPSFPGVKTHEAVLAANVRIHGCTVHFVDEGVDTGSIILQEAVPVLLTDTVETLQERVKNEAEHKIFPLALEHLARGEVVFDKKLRKAIWTI